MSGILDLASCLRRGAAVILALLDHSNSGEPVSETLKAAAYEAARDLLALSQNLARSEREAGGDDRPESQHRGLLPRGTEVVPRDGTPTLRDLGSDRKHAETRDKAAGLKYTMPHRRRRGGPATRLGSTAPEPFITLPAVFYVFRPKSRTDGRVLHHA